MKPIRALKSTLLACSLAALLVSSAVGAATVEQVIQSSGNVSYVSGGVGDESLARLTAMSGEFNLKLVFAMNSGEFVSGVNVAITDAKGRSVVEARSDGPWFLTRLPAGNYQIVASLGGKAEKRQIEVGTSKLATIDFRWSGQ